MLVFADVDVAGLRQLVELPFDHAQRDVAQQPDDLERVLRQRHRHRLDVQVVAEQNRDVVAPARVHRQPSAPQIRAVDDVVVDQRRGVDEFDDRGIEHGPVALVAGQTRRHQQNGRTHPFAAAVLDIAAHLRDERDPRLDVPDELLFDGFQILADGFEDLRQVGGDGGFLRCIAQRGCRVYRAFGRLRIVEFRAGCQRAKPFGAITVGPTAEAPRS